MTNVQWLEWAEYHTQLFRWTAPEDMAMLKLWREPFESRGYTLSELRQASLALAESPKAGIWRAEHFEFILRHVGGRRLAAAQQREEAERRQNERPECRLCNGSGLVVVPSPRSVRGGDWVWPFYTASVTCLCDRAGRWHSNHARYVEFCREKQRKQPPKMLTLTEYEHLVPSWFELMADRETKRVADRKAREETTHADKRRGPLAIGSLIGAMVQTKTGGANENLQPERALPEVQDAEHGEP